MSKKELVILCRRVVGGDKLITALPSWLVAAAKQHFYELGGPDCQGLLVSLVGVSTRYLGFGLDGATTSIFGAVRESKAFIIAYY
jgi:hypothetical protein